MGKLSHIIELDDKTRELYANFDYSFFLDEHLKESNYSNDQIKEIERGYSETKSKLEKNLRKNKRQYKYIIDGCIRKCHSGGALPTRFKLNELRSPDRIINFYAEGEIMAYFEKWKKFEKYRIRSKKAWGFIVRTGAILGFALTIIKIIEELQK